MYENYKSHDIAIYAGFLKDDKELLECASGGIATALARQVIRAGGYVAGVSYSEDFYTAKYELANSEEYLNRFKGSKYIEIEKGTIYKDVKALLDSGKTVLFFGLPCVVTAIQAYLKKEYANLITCELVCHGPTSPKVHSEYVKYLENVFNSKIIEFSARKKKGTWLPSYLHAKFENGEIFEKEFDNTEYGYAFGIMGRPTCYNCNYKGNNRTGDIMIGDFWGTTQEDPFWNEKGVSVIFVHTEKGHQLLKEADGIQLFETTFEKAVSSNQMVIRSKTPDRKKKRFEKLFIKKGLIYASRHTRSLKSKLKAILS